MSRRNPSELAADRFNASREIVRHAAVYGSDDCSLYTLDAVAGEFVITWHNYRGVSVEFARCSTLDALAAARRRMPAPDEDGEGLGHYVAITAAADRAMRSVRR